MLHSGVISRLNHTVKSFYAFYVSLNSAIYIQKKNDENFRQNSQ